jgi:hypothetical protein
MNTYLILILNCEVAHDHRKSQVLVFMIGWGVKEHGLSEV